jgi:hypothetical protein
MIQMRQELRAYAVVSRETAADSTGRRTQKTITAVCPFCQAEVRIFVWSLCGSGKLCRCGALFQSGGQVSKLVKVAP